MRDALVASLVLAALPAHAQSVTNGKTIAQAHCAKCHAIGPTGTSPMNAAPPFRTLHLRYPVEGLEESLAEGIYTGHPAMPEFRFEPDQIEDLIAYLKSLER
jgi:cytochrome c